MSGNWIPLDDTSDQLLYEGSWTSISGSSRQWNGSVHSTSEVGASCSLWFKGIGVHVRGTIPSGSDVQTFTYTVDDFPEVRVPNTQESTDNYNVDFLRVEDLNEDVHRLTLTNVGPAPFQVDFFEYWPGPSDPIPAPIYPPGPSASASTSRPSSTSSSIDTLPASESDGGATPGRSLSTGAIAGISVGVAIVLIVLGILLFMFLRRRKCGSKPKPHSQVNAAPASAPPQPPVTPFTSNPPPASTTADSLSTNPTMMATSPISDMASPTTVVPSGVIRKSSRGPVSDASLNISYMEPPPGYQEVLRDSRS